MQSRTTGPPAPRGKSPLYSHTRYDADGNLTETIDVDGETTQDLYDADGDVTEVISDGQTTQSFYDADGNVTESINANGVTTENRFDADGNLTASVDGLGGTTQEIYDADGQLTAFIDPSGNTTVNEYDADGNLTETINPLGGTTVNQYDADGNLTATVNADGNATDNAFDADGHETLQTWYASGGGSPTNSLSWTYDADGDLTAASNDNGGYSLGYDADGRVTAVSEPFAVSLTFAYDSDGNRTLVTDSFGGTTQSTYDDANQLLSRIFSATGDPTLEIDQQYDSTGQVTEQTRTDNDGSGAETVATSTMAYDATGNMTSQVYKDGSGTTLANYSYSYNSAGEMTLQIDHGATTSFTYDADGELTGANTTNYAYDSNGNPANTGDVVGPDNQLLSDGTWDYSYDAEGNLTKKVNIADGQTWIYGYDNKNELIQAELSTADPTVYTTGNPPIEDVTYKYDVFGNRLEQDQTAYTGGVAGTTGVQRYAYDGWSPATMGGVGNTNFEVWADLDGSNNLQTEYIRGDNVDQLFARVGTDNTPYWYLTDRQGTVRDIINDAGTVKDSITYDAFGNILSETDSAYRGRYTWDGREYDAETGLMYNRARYYDPTTGRWISQDPLGFNAGDSNLYRYAHNSPTSETDASGLDSINVDGTTVRWDANGTGKSDGAPFVIGYLRNDLSTVQLGEGFGGRVATLAQLKVIAERWKDPHIEIPEEEVKIILSRMDFALSSAPAFVPYKAPLRCAACHGTLDGAHANLAAGLGFVKPSKQQLDELTLLASAPSQSIVFEPLIGWAESKPISSIYANMGSKIDPAKTPTLLKVMGAAEGVAFGAERVIVVFAKGTDGLLDMLAFPGKTVQGTVTLVNSMTTDPKKTVTTLAGQAYKHAKENPSDFCAAIAFECTLGVLTEKGFAVLRPAAMSTTVVPIVEETQVSRIFLKAAAGITEHGTPAERALLREALEQIAARGTQAEREAIRAAPALAQVLRQTSCFVAGTPLLTPEGDKPIESFRVGDLILSRNEASTEAPVEPKVVEETFTRVSPVLELEMGGRLLQTTAAHPFFVRGKGWLCAEQLRAGDLLSSHDGQWITVDAVTELNEVTTVYNLRVSDYHTYFVGAREWGFSVWAHNHDLCTDIIRGALGTAQVAEADLTQLARLVSTNTAESRQAAQALLQTAGISEARAGQIVNELLVMTDSNQAFRMSLSNAQRALELPPGAVSVRVGGPGAVGGDIQFLAADGSVVLRRELKSMTGGYNAFNRELSGVRAQLHGSGEMWIQVQPGTDIAEWLRRFRSTPGRNMSEYSNIRLRVFEENGNILFNGPVVAP